MVQVLEPGTEAGTFLIRDQGIIRKLRGTIVCFNPANGRYTLELDNGDIMSLQVQNVKPLHPTASATERTDSAPKAPPPATATPEPTAPPAPQAVPYEVGSSAIYTDMFNKQSVAVIVSVADDHNDVDDDHDNEREAVYKIRLPNGRELQAPSTRLKPLVAATIDEAAPQDQTGYRNTTTASSPRGHCNIYSSDSDLNPLDRLVYSVSSAITNVFSNITPTTIIVVCLAIWWVWQPHFSSMMSSSSPGSFHAPTSSPSKTPSSWSSPPSSRWNGFEYSGPWAMGYYPPFDNYNYHLPRRSWYYDDYHPRWYWGSSYHDRHYFSFHHSHYWWWYGGLAGSIGSLAVCFLVVYKYSTRNGTVAFSWNRLWNRILQMDIGEIVRFIAILQQALYFLKGVTDGGNGGGGRGRRRRY